MLYFVNIQILTSLHLNIHLPHLLDSKCFKKRAMPSSALDAERKLLWRRSSVNESHVDNGSGCREKAAVEEFSKREPRRYRAACWHRSERFMLSSLSTVVIKHHDPGNFRRICVGLTVLWVGVYHHHTAGKMGAGRRGNESWKLRTQGSYLEPPRGRRESKL